MGRASFARRQGAGAPTLCVSRASEQASRSGNEDDGSPDHSLAGVYGDTQARAGRSGAWSLLPVVAGVTEMEDFTKSTCRRICDDRLL